MSVTHRWLSIDRTRVFFPEAGDPAAPTVLISQNGNAYAESLSEGWSPLQR